MAMTFYPHEGDLGLGSHEEKLETLLSAAERFKAVILEIGKTEEEATPKKTLVPREVKYAFNWDELAKILREIRDLPENTQPTRLTKAQRLKQLAEIYEVLRAAKMPKLEAVRLALVNEAKQLSTS